MQLDLAGGIELSWGSTKVPFELQLFQIAATNPITVALVYRPPKPNRAFVGYYHLVMAK